MTEKPAEAATAMMEGWKERRKERRRVKGRKKESTSIQNFIIRKNNLSVIINLPVGTQRGSDSFGLWNLRL